MHRPIAPGPYTEPGPSTLTVRVTRFSNTAVSSSGLSTSSSHEVESARALQTISHRTKAQPGFGVATSVMRVSRGTHNGPDSSAVPAELTSPCPPMLTRTGKSTAVNVAVTLCPLGLHSPKPVHPPDQPSNRECSEAVAERVPYKSQEEAQLPPLSAATRPAPSPSTRTRLPATQLNIRPDTKTHIPTAGARAPREENSNQRRQLDDRSTARRTLLLLIIACHRTKRGIEVLEKQSAWHHDWPEECSTGPQIHVVVITKVYIEAIRPQQAAPNHLP